MPSGQTKVTLLLELKNKLRGGMKDARKYINDNVKEMKDKLNSLRASHVEAFRAMKDEIPGLGRIMDVLGNPYVKIIAGVTTLIALYGKASAMAGQWHTSMAKVNVTAQLGKKDLGDLSNTLLEIGGRNTADLMEVPEAFNKIISAGLDTKTALDTLEPTLHAAKAGFTDVETVAKAAVNVMNSSGIKDATKIYDILFATLNKGNAEFSDIAQYLPKIIPMARQAGFSLQETAGAYAYLTAQGMSAEQSATGLQNVFKSLSDQQIIFGTSTKRGLKGLGINVFDATGKMKSMLDIITQLQTKMTGLTDRQKVSFLDQIGFDMEAGTAIASMTQDATKLKDILDFTANSGGQLAAAMENAKTSGESWTIMGNQLKKTMIEIGTPVNETFGKLGDELLPMVQRGLVIAKDLFLGIWSIVSEVGKVIWTIVKPIGEVVLNLLEWVKQTGVLQLAFEGVKLVVSAIGAMVQLIVDGLKWMSKQLNPIQDAVKQAEEAANKKKRQSEETVFNDVKKVVVEEAAPIMPPGGTGKMPTDFSPDKVKKSKSSDGSSVSGKAQQVRNITINIGSFIDKFNPQNTEISKMGKSEMEAWMKEMFIRMLRNVETSYQ